MRILLECMANTDYKVPPGISGAYTVMNHQLVGDVHLRTGNTIVTVSPQSTPMDFVNFTATTHSDTGKITLLLLICDR